MRNSRPDIRLPMPENKMTRESRRARGPTISSMTTMSRPLPAIRTNTSLPAQNDVASRANVAVVGGRPHCREADDSSCQDLEKEQAQRCNRHPRVHAPWVGGQAGFSAIEMRWPLLSGVPHGLEPSHRAALCQTFRIHRASPAGKQASITYQALTPKK